jgi:hypothetical protein
LERLPPSPDGASDGVPRAGVCWDARAFARDRLFATGAPAFPSGRGVANEIPQARTTGAIQRRGSARARSIAASSAERAERQERSWETRCRAAMRISISTEAGRPHRKARGPGPRCCSDGDGEASQSIDQTAWSVGSGLARRVTASRKFAMRWSAVAVATRGTVAAGPRADCEGAGERAGSTAGPGGVAGMRTNYAKAHKSHNVSRATPPPPHTHTLSHSPPAPHPTPSPPRPAGWPCPRLLHHRCSTTLGA